MLNGRYGPYIAFEKNNYKIPKGTDPRALTEADVRKLIEEQKGSVKKKGTRKK